MTTVAAIAALLISGLGNPVKLGGDRFAAGTPSSEFPSSTAVGTRSLFTVWGGDDGVRGALIEPNGTTRPHGGQVLGPRPGLVGDAQVAWAKGVYLIVWTRERLVVEGVRFDEDGQRLDAAPFVVFRSLTELGRLTAVASNDQFLVAWRSEQPPTVLSGVRVLPSALVLDLAPITIAEVTGVDRFAGSSDGTDFLFLWSDGRQTQPSPPDLFGARVSAAGVPLDADGFVIVDDATPVAFPQVVWTGAHYLIAYAGVMASARELRVRPLAIVDGGPVVGPVTFNAGNGFPIGIASRPPTAGFLWFTDSISGLSFRLLDGDGTPASAAVKIAGASYGASGASLVGIDAGYFATYTENDNGQADVACAVIALSGAVANAVVTVRVNDQAAPTVARSGMGTFVGWNDLLLSARVKRIESATPPVGIGAQTRFQLAASETSVVAVAEAPFSRVEQFGLQGLPPATVGSGRQPAVAARGNRFLVVWEGRLSERIEAVLTSEAGTVGPWLNVGVGSSGAQRQAAVASSADGYFVAWVDERALSRAVYGIEVGPTGEVRGPAGGTRISPSSPHAVGAPSVARGKDAWLVAWELQRSNQNELEAAWVRPGDGGLSIQPINPFPATPRLRMHPVAGRIGDDVMLAWEESDGGNWDVMAVQLGAGPSTVMAVAASVADERAPAVSASTDGIGFIAYTVGPVELREREVFGRAVEWLPLGKPCTSADACGSGLCTDGVCCNSACGGGTSDCMACSVAQGGAVNGVCGPMQGRVVCRAAVSVCDSIEECVSTATDCPVDVGLPDGTACVAQGAGGACTAGVCAVIAASRCDAGGTCPSAPPIPRCGCGTAEGSLGAFLLLALVSVRGRRGTGSSRTARPSGFRGGTAS